MLMECVRMAAMAGWWMPVRGVLEIGRIHKRFLTAESCFSSASDGSKWKRLNGMCRCRPVAHFEQSNRQCRGDEENGQQAADHCYGAGDCSSSVLVELCLSSSTDPFRVSMMDMWFHEM